MRALYPKFIWKLPSHEKKIYLTFDDGPIPSVTEFTLETLEKHNAKATFFCIGDNIRKNPTIFQRIIAANHAIGNHTFNHLNGWKTPNETYLKNVEKCSETIQQNYEKTTLFRPPYGRIKNAQSRVLLPHYQIVMWDVLSGDFSKELTPETVLKETIRNTSSGSIVLFHDSLKANKNMSYALPRVLEHFSEKGFIFDKISFQ